MKYPKMQTLWKRDPDNKYQIMIGEYTHDEFKHYDLWHITEKIDGTNIRIILDTSLARGMFVDIRGRTDNAQMHPTLMKYLSDTFTLEMMKEEFGRDDEEDKLIILYGEGIGPKISVRYTDEPGFVLFDVRIGHWWLKQKDVTEIADRLGVPRAPVIGITSLDVAEDMVSRGAKSILSEFDIEAEGIVARSHPLLLLRNGQRLMWKLKTSDYRRLDDEVLHQ